MMSCASMRERMLEAELWELEGEGASVLAQHLRECRPCRAVGRALLADTEALARTVATSPIRPPTAPARMVSGLRRLQGARWYPEPRAVALALPLVAALAIVMVSQPGRTPARAVVSTPVVGGSESVGATEAPEPSLEPVTGSMDAGATSTAGTGTRPSPVARAGVRTEGASAVASAENPRPGRHGGAAAPSRPASAVPNPICVIDGFECGAAVGARNLDVGSRAPRLDHVVRVSPAAGTTTILMRTRDPAITVVWVY